MKVHATDELFGLEEFSRSLQGTRENDVDSAGGKGALPDEAGALPDEAGALPDEAGALPDEAGALPDEAGVLPDEAGVLPGEAGVLPETAGGLFRTLALLLAAVLLAAVVLSLFSLYMKTQRRAVSYELARQTRLFSRISKQKAVQELEYAYLRATSPAVEEFQRMGWREVTPHEVIHIPLTPAPRLEKGKTLW